MKKQPLAVLIILSGFIAGGYGLSQLLLPSAPSITSSERTIEEPALTRTEPGETTAPSGPPAPSPSVLPAPVAPSEDWNGADYAQVLAGTQIDGELKVDEQGNLVIDLGVKDFFDYFLSAIGEVTPEQAIEQIRTQARLRVPEPALSQTMELLADYVTYQHMMQDFMQRPLASANEQNYQYYAQTLQTSFEQIRTLRRQVFTPAAVEAFFALDEAYAEYAVASIQVQADTSLSDDDRLARLQQLKELLPEQMRIADIEAQQRANAVRQAQTAWQENRNEAAAREILRQTFDDETISDTLNHFKRESQWQERLNYYLAQRQQILEAQLSETARETQLEQLRETLFEEKEDRLRAEAHERMEAESRDLAALSKNWSPALGGQQ